MCGSFLAADIIDFSYGLASIQISLEKAALRGFFLVYYNIGLCLSFFLDPKTNIINVDKIYLALVLRN